MLFELLLLQLLPKLFRSVVTSLLVTLSVRGLNLGHQSLSDLFFLEQVSLQLLLILLKLYQLGVFSSDLSPKFVYFLLILNVFSIIIYDLINRRFVLHNLRPRRKPKGR